jgi:gluconokinase
MQEAAHRMERAARWPYETACNNDGRDMIIVVMGVAGSGKTTVGRLVAESAGFQFLDADALHSPANVAKMKAGTPLSDADRGPWLTAVRERLVDAAHRQHDLVVACSALKEAYRAFLSRGVPVTWTYLKGSPDVMRDRLMRRTGHFMSVALLSSQFDALEEPADAIVVDASQSPEAIVDEILSRLKEGA